MAKEETINLDKEELKEVETFSPDDMPPYPVVADPPEGWPPLRACDGDTWYEKACLFEAQTGRRVLPIEYCYAEDGETIIKVEDRVSAETVKEEEAKDGVK